MLCNEIKGGSATDKADAFPEGERHSFYEKMPEVSEYMVADAVDLEPVSSIQFPANREINREFRQIPARGAILNADTRANSEACSEIPYSAEQGIFAKEQGICAQRTGNFSRQVTIIAGRGF
jgi:hypothetical protein